MADPLFIGSAVLVSAAGLGTAVGRLWPPTARGRHRAMGAAPSPAAAAAIEDALARLRANLPPAALPTAAADDGRAHEPARNVELAALLERGEADALDYDYCPREQRTQPHALRADGSRRCWACGHETAGDQ
ncbi:hypothetical protein PH213_20645 [Streptomyces sp. SRF1]|uniref:hypothetical protein n=1 Tax=Streptomyces sp. SRF1 TaxID=1549642 RepID=UPI0025B1B268|nr:hypothetical protein [Streptomyces sp. SRF1]MDN3056916.1 hypothetical protein [Streptomyces sp. SRF1]